MRHDKKYLIHRRVMTSVLFFSILILASCSSTGSAPLSLNGAQAGITQAPTEESSTQPPAAPRADMDGRSSLTGLPSKTSGTRPYAVMVNNAPAARPQWGMNRADIVLEGLVEGGITRMLWLFSDVADIPKVGPIRSARHDFVEVARGWDAIFLHWGGSPQAYTALQDNGVTSIDGKNYVGSYFHRDQSRSVAIEHTGYTTGDDIQRVTEAKSWRTNIAPAYTYPFTFTPAEAPRSLPDGSATRVSFSFSNGFLYTFQYDETDKLYYQRLNGDNFRQSDGTQHAVTNVFLLFTPISTMDAKGRIDMDLSGGSGLYFSGGTQEKITWKKGDINNSLQFYAGNGKVLTLNRGRSYIGLVPDTRAGNVAIQ